MCSSNVMKSQYRIYDRRSLPRSAMYKCQTKLSTYIGSADYTHHTWLCEQVVFQNSCRIFCKVSTSSQVCTMRMRIAVLNKLLTHFTPFHILCERRRSYLWIIVFFCFAAPLESWRRKVAFKMTEYWLISAPGDKTCQQTWETMNNLTSKQNSLSVNYKFHIPDLKVGTLDQLVGLSDDLGKLDAFVEQVTRKVATYLGEVLEDQRDKLHENLLANNSEYNVFAFFGTSNFVHVLKSVYPLCKDN